MFGTNVSLNMASPLPVEENGLSSEPSDSSDSSDHSHHAHRSSLRRWWTYPARGTGTEVPNRYVGSVGVD